MLKISRESEINLVNVLIDNDIISGKDLINIKKVSTENNKSQIDAIFELKLTDEQKIIDLLIKEQNLETVDLKKVEISEDVKTVCHDVMRHRIGLSYEAEAENVSADELVSEVLNAVEIP